MPLVSGGFCFVGLDSAVEAAVLSSLTAFDCGFSRPMQPKVVGHQVTSRAPEETSPGGLVLGPALIYQARAPGPQEL